MSAIIAAFGDSFDFLTKRKNAEDMGKEETLSKP